MTNLLSLILKNKITNRIFIFVFTILIFSLSCITSTTIFIGIGSFLVVFISGAIALNFIKYCDKQYQILNEDEE